MLPEDATQAEITGLIKDFNKDKRISGIVVQLPLPPGCSGESIYKGIRADKDVDGLNPINVASMCWRPW